MAETLTPSFVFGAGRHGLAGHGVDVGHPVDHVGLRLLSDDPVPVAVRRHHGGGAGLVVYVRLLGWKVARTLRADDTGAQLVAYVLSPVEDNYAVSQAGEPVGRDVAGGAGADHHDVWQEVAPLTFKLGI